MSPTGVYQRSTCDPPCTRPQFFVLPLDFELTDGKTQSPSSRWLKTVYVTNSADVIVRRSTNADELFINKQNEKTTVTNMHNITHLKKMRILCI